MDLRSNMSVVQAAYHAFATNDLDRYLDTLAPNFVSRQSDAVPWRGTYRGREGVAEMFGKVTERATASFDPDEFIDGGDRIVVVGTAHITPKATGQRFDVRELHIWHVQHGQLRGMDVFLNAPAPLLAALDTE